MTLPNFLICGAGKCGSTTLWAVLRQHPQIFMPFDKEPKFFASEETTRGNHAHGLAWYESLFAPARDEIAIGEASMAYFFDVHTPRLIKEHLGAPKLIFILRDPSDRAHSHYWGERRRGDGLPSFDEVVRTKAEPYWKFQRAGNYASNLKRFLEHHEMENMLCLRFEDLKTRPDDVFVEICRFVGVDPALLPTETQAHSNPAAVPRSDKLERLMRNFPLKQQARSVLPDSLLNLGRRSFLIAKRLNRRAISKGRMSDESRALLVEEFHDEICELEALLNWNLTTWKSVEPNTRQGHAP